MVFIQAYKNLSNSLAYIDILFHSWYDFLGKWASWLRSTVMLKFFSFVSDSMIFKSADSPGVYAPQL